MLAGVILLNPKNSFMKHAPGRPVVSHKNPLLSPLPLSAMIMSTGIMIAIGLRTLFFIPPAAPRQAHHVHYVCEKCGRKNVFGNPLLHKPEAGKDNSANFHPVITKIGQGRYRPTIETERLLLREVTLNDVPALNAMYSKIENAASSAWKPHKNSEETKKMVIDLIDKYRRGLQAHWLVCLKKTGETLGFGGFNAFIAADNRDTIGWTLDSSFWGKGYGTELAKACIEYGMKVRKLNRIDAIVRVDNIASRKVLEKAGMNLSACFRQYWRIKGELMSHYQFVILQKDIATQLQQSKV